MSDILCVVTRSAEIESFHIAYGVVAKPNGDIIVAFGNPHLETYVRSSAKPFQAMALYRSNAIKNHDLKVEDIAISCSSHSGQDIHINAVKNLLAKMELSPDLLKCGTHAPLHYKSSKALILKGEEPSALHNNCSGKHAGMLTTASQLGSDLDSYLDVENTTQKLIYDILCEYTDRKLIHRGVDGCSAPVFFISLKELAMAFARLMDQKDEETELVAQAMMSHPELVGGDKRFDTQFMSLLKGKVVSKGGAEGVTAAGIRLDNGEIWGAAIKVLDGNHRAVAPAMLSLLQSAGAFNDDEIEKLKEIREPVLKNHAGLEIGHIKTFMNEDREI